MKIKYCAILLAMLVISEGCLAAESAPAPLAQDGSVGKRASPAPDSEQGNFPFVALEQWAGTKFIFLPRNKKLQEYDYQRFHVHYKDYVGRIATVVAIESGRFPVVHFKMDDDRKELQATAYSETIDDIGPVADIEKARTKWLGKTLWLKAGRLHYYDADIGKFGSVEVPRFSPVVVKNIVAGWYSHSPVRLIVETSTGDQGFFDVNLSGTNVSETLRDNSKFEDYFFDSNPKTIYKWSKVAWDAVIANKVYVGMTAEQARLSWGEPREVNRTISRFNASEQWVYDSGSYLYVEGGKIAAIQN